LACERYGKLDVLVNNAGIGPISLLDDLRVEDWEEMIDVNIKGVLYGIAAALPVFRKQGFGHFVNTASTAGLITKPTMSVYSGTKFAVRAISEGLRQEGGDKLRVTIISPGFVHTDFAKSLTNPEVKAQIVDTIDKMAISPDAIARAIAFAIEQSVKLLQVYVIGNEVCTISEFNHVILGVKGYSVRIYSRESDTWKIRMDYAN
jgi:NADP-dependent 3-hydroxy acid dehydrogenase YdfG